LRWLLPALALVGTGMAAGWVRAQEPAASVAPGTPKVYALIAAVGARFNTVYEEKRTGSHLPPYRRNDIKASGNLLNRIVLRSLDREVAGADPAGQRILMALDPSHVDAAAPAMRESTAIAAVVSALQGMPQRAAWDRILVVTPAYSALERDGLASRLLGLGVFIEPLCESDVMSCEHRFRPPSGPKAMTPEGEVQYANHYLAPFSYVTVWVIDPANLAVLDRQEVFDHQKLFDPLSGSLDLGQNVSRQFLANRVIGVIDRSVQQAFRQTELAGRVDIREIREVKPGSGTQQRSLP